MLHASLIDRPKDYVLKWYTDTYSKDLKLSFRLNLKLIIYRYQDKKLCITLLDRISLQAITIPKLLDRRPHRESY